MKGSSEYAEKLSRTADKMWSSSMGLSLGLADPHCKKEICEIYMTFGTLNIRGLYRTDSLIAVSKEISKCKLGLAGVQKVR